MPSEDLYKRLLNREDLKDIPLVFMLRICVATLEELDNCLREERDELYEF